MVDRTGVFAFFIMYPQWIQNVDLWSKYNPTPRDWGLYGVPHFNALFIRLFIEKSSTINIQTTMSEAKTISFSRV